jgi:gentisate 1,2-dioxygenase
MTRIIDDSAAIDVFMNTHCYEARDGFVVKNLPQHPVHARPNRGNAGAYFEFGKLKALEAHISELPPGQETKIHRHTCEALFYVLAGKGYSVIWEDGESEKQVEWQAGDLFFTPMFVWHRHVNADRILPARYLEITTLPLMKALGAWRIESRIEEG